MLAHARTGTQDLIPSQGPEERLRLFQTLERQSLLSMSKNRNAKYGGNSYGFLHSKVATRTLTRSEKALSLPPVPWFSERRQSMDDRRFDGLAKIMASGASRRSILKGLLGLGGAAALVPRTRSAEVDAPRRPAPTSTPVSCPGQQVWNGTASVCSSGVTCGPTCCDPGMISCMYVPEGS